MENWNASRSLEAPFPLPSLTERKCTEMMHYALNKLTESIIFCSSLVSLFINQNNFKLYWEGALMLSPAKNQVSSNNPNP
jgi:hypothetical protein